MISSSSHDATVHSFYLAFYGRPADPAGLRFWAKQLDNADGDLSTITGAFAYSQEARLRFGEATASERIIQVYRQLFNREPEADGLAYWVDVVGKGHASLADVSVAILRGAQHADLALCTLRQQAADRFTALVDSTGASYSGVVAVEAASLLLRAVTAKTTEGDMSALVTATATLTQVATKEPSVMIALGSGPELLKLFDTSRGSAEPAALLRTLAATASAAAADDANLLAVLNKGGIAQVLSALPAKVSLAEVAAAMETGGLQAMFDIAYPPPSPPPPPEPSPVPPPEPSPVPMPEPSPAPTPVAAAPAPTLAFDYRLADAAGALMLEASAGTVTGIGRADGLALKALGSGIPQGGSGEQLQAAFSMSGNLLSFDSPLAMGMYEMSWGKDSFTTDIGHAAAGSVVFAGGTDGLFSHSGFGIARLTTVAGELARPAAEQVSEAFIDDGMSASRIVSGGAADVIVDHGGTLTIVFDSFKLSGTDLVLGFDSGNDRLSLEDNIAAAIDDDGSWPIQWQSAGPGRFAVDGRAEAVSLDVDASIRIGTGADMGQTVQTLNDALDLRMIGKGGDLLILAHDDSGSGAALFIYLNQDGDGQLDAAELTALAVFGDGAPTQDDIGLIGIASGPPET